MPKLIKDNDKTNAKKKLSRELKSHLKIVRTAEIDVPKQLLYIDNNGKESIINTLTSKKNISRRNKKTVFEIGISNDNNFHIKNAGQSRTLLSSNFNKDMANKQYQYHGFKHNESLYDAKLKGIDRYSAGQELIKLKRLTRPKDAQKLRLNELLQYDKLFNDASKKQRKLWNMYETEDKYI
jgi:hypothetical protein